MARLIPQKQIEEINIFKDNVSAKKSVFISGSLLVSQSIDIGSDLETPQRITGSVQITGSLEVAGPLSFANANDRLDATASFADESVDTQRFGGILAKEFGESDATLYVSSTNGSDDNDGRTPQFPLRTIKKAAKIATDGDDGRYGLPTGSLFTGFAIKVDTGTYLEDNPIELPKNTTVWGSGLRVTKVLAKNENEDLFWVNSGNYLSEMTFGNLRVFPSVDVSEKGFAVAFAPNAFITTSPYVQNCSMISNQENSFLEAYEEIPPGGGGLNVDGNRIHPDSPLASMVLDAYTQIAPNGVGCQVVGRGFIQLVSFFTNFSAYSVKVVDGGQAVLLNSNTSFGDYGMYASGSRFITGSGGNADAFFNVQDNYSIIVDTIKNGLSSIPDLVPNTFEGRRLTDPNEVPQYFVSEDSTDDVAERVKSDFRLVSSIVEDGITNVPKLLAKSGKGGYGSESLYNVGGGTQYTNEATASDSDVSFIDTNFDITLDIIERGNAATSSYVQISNVSSSIKVTDIATTQSFAVQSDTSQRIVDRFDTVISIIENGLTFSPDVVSNASANYVFTETSTYETDVTSSLEAIQSVSSSFSIVYDILANGTGSLPTTILSSSVENPSVDIQNAYTLLIENIPFIQDETIAYLSSSWSDHSYNQETCKRDVGFIISSSAHDLLFGGNEESIRSGVYYYQFPSNATTTEKDPTLTGVKYASELAINILGGKVFTEPSVELDNAYDVIYQNKDFVRAETIAYISSSWSEFEYNEASCSRDVGYILDAVATDIHYGGNERSVTAGEFYYKYPSLATVDDRTTGQLQQTLDGIKYAKRITQKLANNDTFVTASASVVDTLNLIKENRSLIQDETITYIDTQYPNFSYDRVKCRRDVGYIIDNVMTDLLYGGNERSELAGLYYFLYPSIANTTQLEETLEAIRYTKEFTKAIVQSIVLETPQVILNVDGNIRTTLFEPTTGSIGATDTEVTIVSQSFGVIEDIIRYGTDSVLSSIAGNSDEYLWNLENPLNVSGISQITSSNIASGDTINLVTSSFDTIIKIIQSGSSITTEETIGTDSKGNPISTVGIPKNSYGDNLVTTTIGTTIPSDITLVKNTEAGIKFGSGTQTTSSVSTDSTNINKVSSSFVIVSDIIRYGISGSLEISGSSDVSTYFEVVTLYDGSFNINKLQTQKFDDVDGRILGENTGSFEDSVKDPTLTLKRGDLYTFSINSLNNINAIPNETEPFFITTQRSVDSKYHYNDGITNNGTTFGTITFIVPFDAPDTLFYVNGNDVNASGIINIVDELPLSDTQRYVDIPSLGSFEVVSNNVDNIKVSDTLQYTSEYTASISESIFISSSFASVVDILTNGVGNLPTIVENTSGSIKVTNTPQIISSITPTEYELNNVSSSYAMVIDVLQSGTSSLPIEISNTSASIKVSDVSQYISSSVSGTLENVEFISSSVSIVYNMVQLGSSGSYTASLYDTGSGPQTDESTIAAYEIIRNNISFIQSESLAYLSSSWSTASYDEVKCGRDIGLIISGAAEDLIWNTTSASVVNGKFYLEYPSQAETSQLNQTLDGIEYASKLTQKLIQNIEFVSPTTEASASHQLLLDNKELIQNETIEYISSSWADFTYSDILCKRDVGHIVDAVATDVLYGGNERSVQAASFYFSNPSAATGSQLTQTVDAIDYARRLSNNVLQNNVFQTASQQTIEVAKLITENKELIKGETIEFLSSSWNAFEYDDIKCARDVGYILDAVRTDFVYGGNERSINAGEFYYLYPSDATGSQLIQTVDGVEYAQRLTNKLINNVTLVTASIERQNVHSLLLDNRDLIQSEVISFMSSSWSNFQYDDVKCRRDVGHIIDAVATDILYGGNERSVTAGEFYYLYPSEATTVQSDQTITGINHAAGLADKIIQNTLLVNADTETISAYNTMLDNKELVQSNVTEFIDQLYPYFTYDRVKCRRDVGYIVDAVATDLLWGGNERSIVAGDYYYRYPSKTTSLELTETTMAIEYANVLVNDLLVNNELIVPSITSNTENNIRFTDTEQYNGSLSISGSNLTNISSSFSVVVDTIQNGLSSLPTEIKSTSELIKVTNATQISSSLSGSETQIGIISASIDMINDIIRLGSDDIPFTIAKYFQTSELDTPQNLTTGSISISSTEAEYNDARAVLDVLLNVGDYGVDLQPPSDYTYYDLIVAKRAINPLIPQELEDRALDVLNAYNEWQTDVNADVTTERTIVSESFSLINDIIENGVDTLPTLVLNTENTIKVTNLTQFTSSINGTSTEITKVSASVDIVENIVQNGLSVLPTIVENNTNIDNLIKVGSVEQYVSASGADKIQSKILSSSFGLVIDGLTNGTGSLPTIVEYIERVDAPKTVLAYNLIKENIEFIKEETIQFMSSSWSNFVYNEASCSRDVGLIVSGAAEDLINNSNSASIVNTKFYFEYPSEATGSQLDQTVTAIRYASNLAQNIVRNYEYVTASVEVSSSYNLLVENKEFIVSESIQFVSSSWSDFDYNQNTCGRDIRYIVDAVATDLLYGGNERSVTAGRYYYDYPSSAIVGGVPSSTQQKDPTVTAINYVKGLATKLVGGSTFVTSSNEVEYVYDSLRLNREFIQNETIAFVNAKYPNLQYNEASCKRDTGFIVDAVATDLRWGGNQRSLTAGEFYYRFPSQATNVQLGETTDAVTYASDLVNKIVLKNTLPIPSASLNTDNNIKVTDVSQYTGSLSANQSDIDFISSSIDIVTTIIANGTGSYLTASEYSSQSTDVNTLEAYEILKNNIGFIQSESIAYLSSSWSGFEYNEASCSRDVGLIISGAAEDLLYGAYSASIVNGKFYYEYPSAATGSQLDQTLDGIFYASRLAQKLVQNITYVTSSIESTTSYNLLRDNKEFIQSESIAYISSSWSTFGYNEETCKRDIGYIVDAVATDILYGGNERSVIAGDFYHRYPSNATTSELEPTTTGIEYAGDLAEKIIVNEIFTSPSVERVAGNENLLQNRGFIQSESISYITSAWSNFEYNEASCSRDLGYIVDAVATDFLYGGNERSRTAGEFYYKFPSSATVSGSESPNVNAQLYPTIDGIKYANGIAQQLVQNNVFVTASNEVSSSWNLLRDNKEFIQNEVIAYVSSSWSGVYYNEDKCKRDVGYLIDASATDLYYGGNERSINAGSFYYLFPSSATEKGVPSTTAQLDPTVDGIRYAGKLSTKVIKNEPFVQPSASVLVGADLLVGNKEFIQKETIAFLSSSWSEFEYNEASCSRDIGYIIDAVRTDLVYGGNERSVQAGTFYYYIPSVATTEQKPQTTDGIDFAKGLSEKVILKDQLVRAPFRTRESVDLLRASKKELQSIAISYTNGAFPNFTYNEEKCYRDTGFIVDAIATDLYYGGNERSIAAAESYYTGVYGSAAEVITNQQYETADVNRYLRTQFQRIVRNSPLEEFGSLIITTGHDFSYAGSGVTYKALPPNQGGAGVPDPDKEITEIAGGRVFFTSGNELGDFRIGTGLVINQATGTLQGRTFSRSLFSLVTPFSLALEG